MLIFQNFKLCFKSRISIENKKQNNKKKCNKKTITVALVLFRRKMILNINTSEEKWIMAFLCKYLTMGKTLLQQKIYSM